MCINIANYNSDVVVVVVNAVKELLVYIQSTVTYSKVWIIRYLFGRFQEKKPLLSKKTHIQIAYVDVAKNNFDVGVAVVDTDRDLW